MRAALVERVPAHVRDLQLRIARRDAVDLAGNPARALDHLVFAAALGHQLHADADAEERPAVLRAPSRSARRPCRAPHRARGGNPRRRRRRAARRGRRARTLSGSSRHQDRLIVAGLARRALEGLRRRVQIARAVIDDRDRHGRACGCGNRPIDVAGRRGGRRRRSERRGRRGRRSRRPRRARPSQPSKKRRSASSRSSPTTMPTCSKRRRASFQRNSDRSLHPDKHREEQPDPEAGASPRCRSGATGTSRRRAAADRRSARSRAGGAASRAAAAGRPRSGIRRARSGSAWRGRAHHRRAAAARGRCRRASSLRHAPRRPGCQRQRDQVGRRNATRICVFGLPARGQ